VLTGRQILALQEVVRKVPVAEPVFVFARDLVRLTRPKEPDALPWVKEFVSWGAGPRASQYLILGAKARAAMDGRSVPDIEDVDSMAVPVLGHRVVVNFQAEAEGVAPERLIQPRHPKK
jgi:MoxR-like ATPase